MAAGPEPDRDARILRELGALHRKFDELRKDVRAATERVANRQMATDARVANHAGRLRAVELREEQRSIAEPGPDWRAETTGTYDVQKLVEESKRRDSFFKWAKRESLRGVAGIVAALVLVVLTAFVTARLGAAPQPPKHAEVKP